MEPSDYDKIVDKLMQIRGKIPAAGTLISDNAASCADRIRYVIDELIHHIDDFAYMDAMGLVK